METNKVVGKKPKVEHNKMMCNCCKKFKDYGKVVDGRWVCSDCNHLEENPA